MSAGILDYKQHLINAFCRSLLLNLSLLVVNSLFIATVGPGRYSQLFFFGSIATTLCYVLLMALREQTVYRLYVVVLLIAGLGSVAVWLQPANHLFLYAFGVIVMVTDMLGANVGGMLLQGAATPAVFRQIYQRVISLELIGRLAASAFVWAISAWDRLDFYFPLAWVALAAHVLVFRGLPRLSRSRTEAAPTAKRSLSVADRYRQAWGFFRSNDLAKIIVVIAVWTYVTKFLTEFLYYQAINSRMPSAAEVGAFVSAMTIGIILLTLAFQQFVARRMNASQPLSMLFSLLPVAVLAIGGLGLAVDPFWPFVALMVVFQCLNRSVQLPVSRQLLVPMPRGMRSSINFFIPLVTDMSVMVVSGLLSSSFGAWNFTSVHLLLLVVAGSIFFFLAQLDAYYVKNMWSMYREAHEGRWRDSVWSDQFKGLAFIDEDEALAVPAGAGLKRLQLREPDEPAGGDEPRYPANATRPLHRATQPLYGTVIEIIDAASNPLATPEDRRSFARLLSREDLPLGMRVSVLLQSYARLEEDEALAAIVAAHRRLLRSRSVEDVIGGLQVLYLAGLQGFPSLIASFTAHPDPAVADYAALCLKATELFKTWSLDFLPAASRLKLKTILFEMLEADAGPRAIAALGSLTLLRVNGSAIGFIDAFFAQRDPGMRQVLLSCLDASQYQLRIEPVLAHMVTVPYGEAQAWRNVLLTIGLMGLETEVTVWLTESLLRHVEGRETFRRGLTAGLARPLHDELLHMLFLTEWLQSGPQVAQAVLETIPDLAGPEGRVAPVLIDLHLEFLKTCDYDTAWVYLLGRNRSEGVRQRALQKLSRMQSLVV